MQIKALMLVMKHEMKVRLKGKPGLGSEQGAIKMLHKPQAQAHYAFENQTNQG